MEFNEAYALISKTDSEENQKLFVLLKRIEAKLKKAELATLEREIELCQIAKEHNVQPLSFTHTNFD